MGCRIARIVLQVSLIIASATTIYAQTDYHVHVQDSATVQLNLRMLAAQHAQPTALDSAVLDADAVIARLNKAGFKTAWIISNAYWFGSPVTPVPDEENMVRKENDWVADQAARYPDRLKALMSINPLKPYALEEIERCAATKHFIGLKLHFANSHVNLFDTAQVAQLQRVFAAANKYQLTILLHQRNAFKWNGRANTRILLDQLLPFAPQTNIIIAHLGGWGGFDKETNYALNQFIAYKKREPVAAQRLFLEMGAVFPLTSNQGERVKLGDKPLKTLQRQLAILGPKNLLFGTDWPFTEIDAYLQVLKKALGENLVQQMLTNHLPD